MLRVASMRSGVRAAAPARVRAAPLCPGRAGIQLARPSLRRQAGAALPPGLVAGPLADPQSSLAAVSQLSLHLGAAAQPAYETAEGLELPIQLIYLLSLLGFLAGGAWLVVRQVLIRRELDETAKTLGERIRTGEATCEDYYELGVILTRKKLFTQATRNLEKARKSWDGEESELAQVHNALGFCYVNLGKSEAALAEFERAVGLQPGYVTAWNNLGDACEKAKDWKGAQRAYREALSYAPNNKTAQQRAEYVSNRLDRLAGLRN